MIKHTKYYIFIIFLCNFIYISHANATTINAKSCSKSDVQAALNSASDGDTVIVPAGESTWTSYVNVNDAVTIQGNGIGSTIIHKYGFQVASGINNFRITGFTFDGDAASVAYGGSRAVQVAGAGATGCKNWRIDHNRFVDYRAISGSGAGVYTIFIRGYSYGVIDNNQFYDCRGEVVTYCGDGSPAWSRSGIGGYTNGTVFIEDNTFALSNNGYPMSLNCVDANTGARYVFRYNTVTDGSVDQQKWETPIDNHGACYGCNVGSSVDNRGTYSLEIYENDFTSSNSSWKRGINLRGGTGVVYNNTFTRYWATNINLMNTRSYSSTCAYGGLCSENEGYPCDDQIFDLYIWNNTDDGGSISVLSQTSDIQKNRDYFLTSKAGYTPYTYPHPLTRGSSDGPPAKPATPFFK